MYVPLVTAIVSPSNGSLGTSPTLSKNTLVLELVSLTIIVEGNDAPSPIQADSPHRSGKSRIIKPFAILLFIFSSNCRISEMYY